jgi:hypothetical protein
VRRVQAFPHLAADLESALAARPRVALSRPDTTVAAVRRPDVAVMRAPTTGAPPSASVTLPVMLPV